jgi:hypothetical protein
MSSDQEKKGSNKAIALVLGLFLIGGGFLAWNQGWIGSEPRTEEALLQRAQLFWDRKTSGDTMGAYEMMAESYRKRVTPQGFASIGQGLIIHTGATVESATLDESGGVVTLELRHIFNKPAFRDLENVSMIKDRWVYENGSWHRWPPGRLGRETLAERSS